MSDEFEMTFEPMEIAGEKFHEETVVEFTGGFVILSVEKNDFKKEFCELMNKYQI